MVDETLREKQSRFAVDSARLILQANQMGLEVTYGETYRSPEQAKLNADKHIGIANSLHIQKLAIDLNLFKGDIFLTSVEDYRALGDWWKALGEDYFWGGDFASPDSDHFSISPDGGRTK